MAVHERKISNFLGLYNTGKPSNSRLGLRSPNVERNKNFKYHKKKTIILNDGAMTVKGRAPSVVND